MAQLASSTGEKLAQRVAVVAAGVVSPLGFGLAETLDSLRRAKDCVTQVTRFSVAECRCKTAGQVPDDRLVTGVEYKTSRQTVASSVAYDDSRAKRGCSANAPI